MPGIEVPRKLTPVLTTKKKFVVLIGGRGSAKSETVARLMLMKASTERCDILCGREYQNSIEDSVHKLLKSLIGKLGIPKFIVTDKKIDYRLGGGFRFRGFARNSDAVKSAQDFKYSWIEEAQSLSQQSLDDLLPTIRSADSQLFFTANPGSSNDPFSQRFIAPFYSELKAHGYYEDELHLIIFINWRDNPWHGELEAQRQWDFEHLPRAKYDHIWEGEFDDTVENPIILTEWFDACIDAHLKLGFSAKGIKTLAHDPSDTGDPRAYVLRHGSIIKKAAINETFRVNDACNWALEEAIKQKCDLFTWDCDGLGVALRQQVIDALDGKRVDFYMFKGSEAVENPYDVYQSGNKKRDEKNQKKTNREVFRNKRAQFYWKVRDRVFNTYLAIMSGEYQDPDTMLSFSSEIDILPLLRSELCRIPRKPNNNGFIQLYTKQEMKTKLKISSPNVADCVMMSLAKLENDPMTGNLEFDSLW